MNWGLCQISAQSLIEKKISANLIFYPYEKIYHKKNVESQIDLLSCTLSPLFTGFNIFSVTYKHIYWNNNNNNKIIFEHI